MRTSYNTKQKEQIINLLKEKKHDFTIKEIYKELDSIGLTTIYRMIDSLLEEGLVQKVSGGNREIRYQYLEKCSKANHFYLKCEHCGVMIHIDCDCIKELSSHIYKTHNFTLKESIMINGLCSNCSKEMKLC